MKRLLSAALVGLLVALLASSAYARSHLFGHLVGGPGPHGGGGGFHQDFHPGPIHVEPYRGGGYGYGIPNVLPYVAPYLINSLLPPTVPPALGYEWARVNGVWTQVPLGTIVGSAAPKAGDSTDPLPAALAALAADNAQYTTDCAATETAVQAVQAAQTAQEAAVATQAANMLKAQQDYQAALTALQADYGQFAPLVTPPQPSKAKRPAKAK